MPLNMMMEQQASVLYKSITDNDVVVMNGPVVNGVDMVLDHQRGPECRREGQGSRSTNTVSSVITDVDVRAEGIIIILLLRKSRNK